MSAGVQYLGCDDVLALHARSIELFGGSLGIRDRGLLESALAMPEASFGGHDMHETLFEKAAAYMYYLTRNHAFVDGNKRIGAAAAISFLGLNGIRLRAPHDALFALVLDVARGRSSKADVAVFLAEHSAAV